MKCAKLQLQDRFKHNIKSETQVCPVVENPRRFCQKRMVNPEHEEDPRWIDIYERYHCHAESSRQNILENCDGNPNNSDLFLTVQTIRFQGDVDQTKKARTSFKYKIPTDGAKHRMFVKQVVDNEQSDEDRSSQLTCYYYDDYVKYLFSNDKSRPNSGKSSIFLQGLSNKRENKATQVDVEQTGGDNKMSQKHDSKLKGFLKKNHKYETKDEMRCVDSKADDTKITYCKSGNKKSLTISRTQSPETVHVIRVELVCNNSVSSALDYNDKKLNFDSDIDIESLKTKRSYFSDKYLLTSTIKKLDENLSGAKVTLLCKTFRLTERGKMSCSNKLKMNSNETFIPNELKKHAKNKNTKSKFRK